MNARLVGAVVLILTCLGAAPLLRARPHSDRGVEGGVPAAPVPDCPTDEHAAVADRVAAVFRTHRFVFFGSTHGGVKRHEFLLCLLSRSAFREAVTDIVVEFASGAHQELLDRYLVELEELPPDSLRPIAFDTDHPPLWATLPQVPEFLRAVREANERVELPERIRVLGASSIVEWSRVRSPQDLARYPFKTNYAAHLITEHLAPDLDARVLVVYGDGHIQHGGTLTGNVEAEIDPDSLFVIGTITSLREGERDLVAAFGPPDEPFCLPADEFPDVEGLPDALVPIVTNSRTSLAEFSESGGLGEKIDALVYLGPSADSDLKGTIPLSEEERRELDRRNEVDGREAMEIRYRGRERWFEGHPREIPPDPREEPRARQPDE